MELYLETPQVQNRNNATIKKYGISRIHLYECCNIGVIGNFLSLRFPEKYCENLVYSKFSLSGNVPVP